MKSYLALIGGHGRAWQIHAPHRPYRHVHTSGVGGVSFGWLCLLAGVAAVAVLLSWAYKRRNNGDSYGE